MNWIRYSIGNTRAFNTMPLSIGAPQVHAPGASRVPVALAGNQPASTGVVIILYHIAVAGNHPTATGALGPLLTVLGLAGNQPAASGAMANVDFINTESASVLRAQLTAALRRKTFKT